MLRLLQVLLAPAWLVVATSSSTGPLEHWASWMSDRRVWSLGSRAALRKLSFAALLQIDFRVQLSWILGNRCRTQDEPATSTFQCLVSLVGPHGIMGGDKQSGETTLRRLTDFDISNETSPEQTKANLRFDSRQSLRVMPLHFSRRGSSGRD